ncbi:Radical SAM domain protein [Desulfurispirillum indicum S5]|uniref:Radical SAM domain protein n=2 Tax=Desulfurispirillum TaxID=393029 RepID=E6W4F7_DESIS|nr:Radical SAM domain protein [Desulfurispirillum indicum S5]
MEARYWSPMNDQQLRCDLCPHRCIIAPGNSGICRIRHNRGGRMEALSYGRVISTHIDPIEKKPLARFFPGQGTLSISCGGCNMRCQHCQNFPISCEFSPDLYEQIPVLSFAHILAQLKKSGTSILSFTYAEPSIAYEFTIDCARAVREAGMHTALITNGYLSDAPWQELTPWISAMNIDLKGDEGIYRTICKAPGGYGQVLRNIATAFEAGVHIELTTLLIPSITDTVMDQLIEDVCAISTTIPWHISAYFPRYQSHEPATTREQVLRVADKIREKKCNFVYTGNI